MYYSLEQSTYTCTGGICAYMSVLCVYTSVCLGHSMTVICMYTYIQIHTYTYTHAYIHTRTHTYIYIP